MLEQIEFTTKNILERTNNFKATIGIILGTGLGALVEDIKVSYSIPYSEIPNFPESTVEGHSGRLILGTMSGKNVVAMQGRYHFYEGYSMQQVTFPVRIMKALGVSTLCVSNASGGMNSSFKVGDIMLITDHINLFPTNPLIGKNDDRLGPRFPDMGELYNKKYRSAIQEIAAKNNIPLQQGVYIGLSGPCFETPAEYRYLRIIGGDAVGMSTVPEVIVARHAGMEILGLSVITDLGVEGHVQEITHEEVIHIAKLQEPKLSLLIREFVRLL
jgi:purine-nucleoside phosphorylase